MAAYGLARISRQVQDEHTGMREACSGWSQISAHTLKRRIHNDGN